jgi:flagellin-like protein
MKYLYDETAVSPVIGVILMVAITVTLAAIVSAFVFGHVDVEKPKSVETRVNQINESYGEFIFIGGPSAGMVKSFNLTVKSSLGATSTTSIANPQVGDTIPITGLTAGQDHVIVAATFSDGTKGVVLDTYV